MNPAIFMREIRPWALDLKTHAAIGRKIQFRLPDRDVHLPPILSQVVVTHALSWMPGGFLVVFPIASRNMGRSVFYCRRAPYAREYQKMMEDVAFRIVAVDGTRAFDSDTKHLNS